MKFCCWMGVYFADNGTSSQGALSGLACGYEIDALSCSCVASVRRRTVAMDRFFSWGGGWGGGLGWGVLSQPRALTHA